MLKKITSFVSEILSRYRAMYGYTGRWKIIISHQNSYYSVRVTITDLQTKRIVYKGFFANRTLYLSAMAQIADRYYESEKN